MADARREALIASANRLGLTPTEWGGLISFESAGTFNPGVRGGAGNRHIGLIQFGPAEQKQFGVTGTESFEEQLPKAEAFLLSRGYVPGSGLMNAYSTVNAGSPGRFNASDAANGGTPGTVADKVNNQFAPHLQKAAAFLGGEFNPKMPSEAGGTPSGGTDTPRAPFSLAGPVGSSAPAPTIPTEASKADTGPDLAGIMKMLTAGAAEGAPAAGGGQAQAAGPALTPPQPAPPRPMAFDAAKFFSLLPTRR